MMLSDGDSLNLESIVNQSPASTARAVFDAVATLEIDTRLLQTLPLDQRSLLNRMLRQVMADKTRLQQMYACVG
jgi:predicted component of type VI protein secretion system